MATLVSSKATIAVKTKVASVDQDPIVLNALAGEQAEWHNPESFPLTIKFAVSPFEKNVYEIPPKGHASSGPIKNANHCHDLKCPWPYKPGHKGTSANGHYKYSIWRGNDQLADPEVVIKP